MTTLTTLPLAQLTESTFNPRKSFDTAKLQELAESIRATGLHQPILVRPLPGARVPDTGAGITHEIVAGARRYRASKLVDTRGSIAVIVRELTDAQALEIAVIENLQRDDLAPLEEADGYQQLMGTSALTADQVAAKIGKSRSYVYGRLKLLDLAPEPRQALQDGRLDASRALLIARIPDGKLQLQATKELTSTNYLGEPVHSARTAAELIQRNYMLRLHDAKFSKTDATLLPEAGACKACPKRTGANPDLFTDVKGADVCTDPPCYRKKEAAHADAALKAARDSGATLIEGRQAKELMPHSWSTRVEGHLRLDDASDSPTDKPLRKLIGQAMQDAGIQPVLVVNPHQPGELVAVLPADQVGPLLAAAGQDKAASRVSDSANSDARYKAAKAKRKAEDALEQGWRDQVLQSVIEAGGCIAATPALLRYAALHFVGMLKADECKALAKRLELGKIAPLEGIEQWVRDHEWPAAAMSILIAARDVAWSRYSHEHGGDANTGLWLAAEALDIDIKAIERRARSDARAAAMAAAKPAKKQPAADAAQSDPPLAPAAQAGGVRGGGQAQAERPAARRKGHGAVNKPVINEAHAREGIAAALQSAGEPEPGAIAQSEEARPVLRPSASAPDGSAAGVLSVGQQVKVLRNVKGRQQQFLGKCGAIAAQVGPDAWDVDLPTGRKGSGLTTRACFHTSELGVV